MTNSPLFSKQELMTEVRNVLFALSRELGRIYTSSTAPRLMGFTKEVCPSSDAMHEALREEVNIDQFAVSSYMGDLYDYAMLGILHADLRDDWEIVEEDIKGFFNGLRDFPLLSNNADDYSLDKSLQVIELSCLRMALDEGGYCVLEDGTTLWGHIALKDLAYLAGIDEKSIRNMATPKAKNPLKTVKHGSRTFVKFEVAKEWLRQRGFKETEYRSRNSERDISITGFLSSTDLGAYVREMRERAELTVSELASRVEKPDAAEKISRLEQGVWDFDVSFLKELAQSLNLNVRPFVMATLQLHQRDEAAKIERQLDQVGQASKSAAL
jgi:ribosome-binding protein aMBF1 (putative translation factor)